jgi:hypothetical protein
MLLLVLSVLPQWYYNSHIPLNNVILGVISLLATMMVQFKWSRHQGKKDGASLEQQSVTPVQNKSAYAAPGLRHRPPFRVSGFFDGAMDSVRLSAAPFTADGYVKNIEETRQMDQVSVLETSITSPILFTTVLAAASPNIPTWALQMVFLMVLLSHLLFLPSRKVRIAPFILCACCENLTFLGQVAQWQAKYGSSNNEGMFLYVCAVMLVIASILLYSAGSVVFFDYVDEIFGGSMGVGTPLQAAVIIMYALKTLYFVGIWVSMGVSANASSGKAIEDAENIHKYIGLGLRGLDVVCNVLSGAIVASLSVNHRLPAYRESPWLDMAHVASS